MNNTIEIVAGDVNLSNNERLISVAGGIALVLAGIKHFNDKRAMSITELFTGVALLLRGGTGHCPVTEVVNRKKMIRSELVEEA